MQYDKGGNCHYCGYGPQHRSPNWLYEHHGICCLTHYDDPPEKAKNESEWRKFKRLPRNFGFGGGQTITLSARNISKKSQPNKTSRPQPFLPTTKRRTAVEGALLNAPHGQVVSTPFGSGVIIDARSVHPTCVVQLEFGHVFLRRHQCVGDMSVDWVSPGASRKAAGATWSNPTHQGNPKKQRCESCDTELPATCYWCRGTAFADVI